jgi:DNA polymerase III subunit gamma/tau
MANDTLANKHRPKTFAEVIGQEEEVATLKKIITGTWRPNALMFTGPFGTGKTTNARLIARALLCTSPTTPPSEDQAYEPCGQCDDCLAMDKENHPCFTEVDAASQGAVSDVRAMKDVLLYRSMKGKIKIIYYDESHMLSKQGQNALLQTLEEGVKDVMFIFATTEADKMLPTVKSRCVELQMKLLSPGQIKKQMMIIADKEGVKYNERALLIVASYVRGHMRDAIIMLEQLSRMADSITESLVRTYLRLDQYVEIYKLLCETDQKTALQQLETLLCNYSASELCENVAQILVNAYKLHIDLDEFTEIDKVWLRKVLAARNPYALLNLAEKISVLQTDYSTINYGIASLMPLLFDLRNDRTVEQGSGTRTAAPATPPTLVPQQFRKQTART